MIQKPTKTEINAEWYNAINELVKTGVSLDLATSLINAYRKLDEAHNDLWKAMFKQIQTKTCLFCGKPNNTKFSYCSNECETKGLLKQQ